MNENKLTIVGLDLSSKSSGVYFIFPDKVENKLLFDREKNNKEINQRFSYLIKMLHEVKTYLKDYAFKVFCEEAPRYSLNACATATLNVINGIARGIFEDKIIFIKPNKWREIYKDYGIAIKDIKGRANLKKLAIDLYFMLKNEKVSDDVAEAYFIAQYGKKLLCA